MTTGHDPSRSIRAPRGNGLNCPSWQTEAVLRMLHNNLDPEVAENPASLVVYGGIGRADAASIAGHHACLPGFFRVMI